MKRTLLVSILLLHSVLSVGCKLIQNASSAFVVNTRQTITTASGQTLTRAPLPNTVVQGDWQADIWGSTPSGYVYSYYNRTNDFGKFTVYSGRTEAYWNVRALCFGITGYWHVLDYLPVHRFDSVIHECRATVVGLPFSSTRFEVAGLNLPSTITLGGQNLTSQNGPPILNLYDKFGNLENRITALSVSGDGTQATFPFPIRGNGSPLTSNTYGMGILNWDTAPQTFCEPMYDEWGNYLGDNCWEIPGEQRYAGSNYLAIGSHISLPTPYGVDAANIDVSGTECWEEPFGDPEYGSGGRMTCTSWAYTEPTPIVTLNSTSQVYYRGLSLAVGNSPTTVKAYRNETQTTNWGDNQYWYEESTTQPSRAIVANSAGNSLSVVDLISFQVIATVPIGASPADLVISPDETRAYVANHGGFSLAEIDLLSNTLVRGVYLGFQPLALAFDSGANAIWAGGPGWLYKVDRNTLSVSAAFTVAGSITSMALSSLQNSLVYTAIVNQSGGYAAPGGSSNSYYSVRQIRLSDMATVADRSAGSASGYSGYSAGGSVPSSMLASGTKVSVNYGNGISVSATPSGFLVMDVTGAVEIMRGTTSSPVRAIAADPQEGVVYLTVPGSNMLITIPLG